MIVPRHYEDLKIMHENTMPCRAYYIPASHEMGALVENRFSSDRLICLNGTWQFQYFESIYDLQEKFYEQGYDCSNFTQVEVPGVWQNYGYDSHQYTNVRYPIPLDPPYVPQENPCGAYIRKFMYQKQEKAPRAYLNFEGVDSCFYVWVNGTYVGYSQVSHATSEFDVTNVLTDGENTLAVLVLKWCDGTYLEDQDKFRMSGIFRTVRKTWSMTTLQLPKSRRNRQSLQYRPVTGERQCQQNLLCMMQNIGRLLLRYFRKIQVLHIRIKQYLL